MEQTEELSARAVINELYKGLLERYHNLGFRDEFFEMDFVEEHAWLRRATKNLSRETPPPTLEVT